MAAIGFYDSGLGGLSILKHAASMAVAGRQIIYMADQEMMPLGERPASEIQARLEKVCEWMFAECDCSLIVLACNTASVTAIRHLQQEWLPEKWGPLGRNILGINVPFLEDIELMFDDMTDDQVVVLSTMSTYASGYYQKELAARGFNNVVGIPMPGVAEAIDSGDDAARDQAIEDALEPYRGQLDDTKLVIVACTHYVYAMDKIKTHLPSDVIIAEPGFTVAQKLTEYLDMHDEYTFDPGDIEYYTTGDDEACEAGIMRLTGEDVSVSAVQLA